MKPTESQTAWEILESSGIPVIRVSRHNGCILELNTYAEAVFAGIAGGASEWPSDTIVTALAEDRRNGTDSAGKIARTHSLDLPGLEGESRNLGFRIIHPGNPEDDDQLVLLSDNTNRLRMQHELNGALKRVESASRARSEFLANVSHEFRTPVSGIIGILSLIRESGLDANQQHLLSLIDGAAGDLERMLQDLLEVSRMDSGKLKLRKERFSVPELLDGVMKMHTRGAAEKGLELTWNSKGRQRYAGDETRLAQVIGNLVSNAVKFTERGSVDVQVSVDTQLSITVRDTGKGIPADKKSEIFEMFSQVENPYTKDRPGLGLGLVIVEKIVDLMEGTISLEDNPDGGSLFRVTIPIPSEPNLADGGSSGEPKVLLVEDDPLSRYYLSTILRRRGFDVVEAADGETALEHYSPDAYIAVLMDVGLPRMSGIEVTSEWRKREGSRFRTPIWAVTAHGFQSDRERCLEAGMDAFFLKPVDEPLLTRKLRQIVEIGQVD